MQLATAVGTAAPAGQGSVLGAFLPVAIVLDVMYFIVIRPQNVQRKKRDQMIANLRKGNRVVTTCAASHPLSGGLGRLPPTP